MHSADYSEARCLSVRPSVCLSHTGILSKRLYKSSMFLSPPGSPTTLVFPDQTGWKYSDGDPPNAGVECKGGIKNHDFRPIARFISELMQDRAIVTMESEQETARKLSNGTILNNLEWPLTQISRWRYYSTSNNSETVQELYLQWRTNRKSYMIYRTAPYSMTLNNPWPIFQSRAILWRWIPQKWYEIKTVSMEY